MKPIINKKKPYPMEFPAVPLVAITLSKAGLQVVSSVFRIETAKQFVDKTRRAKISNDANVSPPKDL